MACMSQIAKCARVSYDERCEWELTDSLCANLADVRPERTFPTAVLAAVLVPALRLLQRCNESQRRGKVQGHREDQQF
jgi:hypothetical protein